MAGRQVSGVVVSEAMQKSRVVELTRSVRHRRYQKVIRRTKRVHVHDPESASHVGDEVRIEECRPLSKTKRWRLIGVTRRTREIEKVTTE